MKTHPSLAALAAILVWSGAAQAALFDRGGGMVYDDVRNITWLSNLNLPKTSGHTGAGVDAQGGMTWDAANSWADTLVHGFYSDWRLPTLNAADATCTASGFLAFNCTGGELSHLFVADLGNKPNESVLDGAGDTAVQVSNLALFSQVQTGVYWSATASPANPASAALGFATFSGAQGSYGMNLMLYAVAVRSGDVTSPVPEPASALLLGLGVAGLLARRRMAGR